jgi:ABC-type transport system involved in cytochrome c biogenesis ATPase subunit
MILGDTNMSAAEDATILQIQGLCFGHAPQQPLFAQVGANLHAGLALIVGGEGSGKTTLLRLLAGELAPQAGRVSLAGIDLARSPQAYRRQVFWRSPQADWPEQLTPAGWAAELAQAPVTAGRWQAQAWHDHVQGFGLAEHLRKEMFRLSTGSKRKVLLAAALASGAPLTLIDEPEAALDKASIAYLHQALERHGFDAGRVLLLAHYERLGALPWRQVLELAN